LPGLLNTALKFAPLPPGGVTPPVGLTVQVYVLATSGKNPALLPAQIDGELLILNAWRGVIVITALPPQQIWLFWMFRFSW